MFAVRSAKRTFKLRQAVLAREVPLDFVLETLQDAGHGYQNRNSLTMNGAHYIRWVQRFLKYDRTSQKRRQEHSEELAENMAEGQQVQKTNRVDETLVLEIVANFSV